MFQLLLLSQLIACGPDARERASHAYAKNMQALWVENHAIGREFMDVAAKIKRKEIKPLEINERFQERVVPRARELATKVTAVETGTEALEQVHAGIVRAWEIRADAYEQMMNAWNNTDMQSYSRALNDNHAVRQAEGRYLEATNQLLAPYQVQLDPMP